MIIAVDFDGVIHERTEYGDGQLGEPLPGAIEALNELHAAGHRIKIHTARMPGWRGDRLEASRMLRWLRDHGCAAELTFHPKTIADVYLDDKALSFTSWEHALFILDERIYG